jgi:putative peptidoglycan lipid II flippase
LNLRLSIDWRHPALRRILALYAPIALGLLVTIFQVALDRRLASGTGAQSIAWMANATTLQQMPLGLISVAIAIASLPRLSQYFASGNDEAYRHTLGDGLRLVVLLIVPAAVLLWMLGTDVVTVLFQRNLFTPGDTEQVVLALNIYLLGMVFAAIDFPLNYAFYARQNTLLPAIVGVFSVGVYMLAAFALLGRLGYLGLVWADTAKQAAHAAVMLGVLRWRVGSLHADLAVAVTRVAAAAGLMALAVGAVDYVVTLALTGTVAALVSVVAGGLIGTSVYVLMLLRLRVPEMKLATRYVGERTALMRNRTR